jgi:hypothetical protein
MSAKKIFLAIKDLLAIAQSSKVLSMISFDGKNTLYKRKLSEIKTKKNSPTDGLTFL